MTIVAPRRSEPRALSKNSSGTVPLSVEKTKSSLHSSRSSHFLHSRSLDSRSLDVTLPSFTKRFGLEQRPWKEITT